MEYESEKLIIIMTFILNKIDRTSFSDFLIMTQRIHTVFFLLNLETGKFSVG